MKLLLCPECDDIFNLSTKLKKCSCGKTKGKYKKEGINATFSGGIPFCIHNRDFVEALSAQRYNDVHATNIKHGVRFEAWICPKNSDTFKEDI